MQSELQIVLKNGGKQSYMFSKAVNHILKIIT